MKKTILITGARGFLGRSLIEGMDKTRYEIYALDFFPEEDEDSSHIADYFSRDICRSFQLPRDFDAVIHLAAFNRTNIDSDYDYEQFHRVNVAGTENVVQSCNFRQFIFFSSANIYDKRGLPIDEHSPIKPHSFYERSKYEGEMVCQELIPPEKLVILRPVNITGIKQSMNAIVPFFFRQGMAQQTLEVFVPQNRRIQLLSAHDLVRALDMILSQSGLAGIFNLAGSDNISVKELGEKVVALCRSQSKVICTNSDMEDFSPITADKAKKYFLWQAEDNISAILEDYLRYLISIS
ncbi:NAD-dependent epimerase/dehydratase family protein [Dehalobacterium formicoaceticum]|uniref:NAD(P)-dependent oxidoreductase n=1 Tax=Dehalobacterium formicoaceticum TaxID=51515 RepID=A0ABT1Y0T0_9FIRM|nr:NAD(P)-dependent oxidoreductase [Dehalobacterium formicoaceticum]MCR6544178.1 NAD(P)-dependent oxidoreductase [Dehalobacterium formicoaceticum]